VLFRVEKCLHVSLTSRSLFDLAISSSSDRRSDANDSAVVNMSGLSAGKPAQLIDIVMNC
jgi:hypothetical protein